MNDSDPLIDWPGSSNCCCTLREWEYLGRAVLFTCAFCWDNVEGQLSQQQATKGEPGAKVYSHVPQRQENPWVMFLIRAWNMLQDTAQCGPSTLLEREREASAWASFPQAFDNISEMSVRKKNIASSIQSFWMDNSVNQTLWPGIKLINNSKVQLKLYLIQVSQFRTYL